MSLDGVLSASLQSWLGQELENRGIDAVVYTRHILSILQQDSLDAPDEDLFASSPIGRGKNAEGRGAGAEMDVEILKKTAAVKCLLSVTDDVRV